MQKTFIESAMVMLFFGGYHGYLTSITTGANVKNFNYGWCRGFAQAGLLILVIIPVALGFMLGDDYNLYLVYFVQGFFPYYGIGYMMYGVGPLIFKKLNIEGSLPSTLSSYQ